MRKHNTKNMHMDGHTPFSSLSCGCTAPAASNYTSLTLTLSRPQKPSNNRLDFDLQIWQQQQQLSFQKCPAAVNQCWVASGSPGQHCVRRHCGSLSKVCRTDKLRDFGLGACWRLGEQAVAAALPAHNTLSCCPPCVQVWQHPGGVSRHRGWAAAQAHSQAGGCASL